MRAGSGTALDGHPAPVVQNIFTRTSRLLTHGIMQLEHIGPGESEPSGRVSHSTFYFIFFFFTFISLRSLESSGGRARYSRSPHSRNPSTNAPPPSPHLHPRPGHPGTASSKQHQHPPRALHRAVSILSGSRWKRVNHPHNIPRLQRRAALPLWYSYWPARPLRHWPVLARSRSENHARPTEIWLCQ